MNILFFYTFRFLIKVFDSFLNVNERWLSADTLFAEKTLIRDNY